MNGTNNLFKLVHFKHTNNIINKFEALNKQINIRDLFNNYHILKTKISY